MGLFSAALPVAGPAGAAAPAAAAFSGFGGMTAAFVDRLLGAEARACLQ